MKQGLFIVIEGIDGAGTSTQAELACRWLKVQGVSALLTREPSSGPIGCLIRQVLSKRLVVPSAQGPSPPGWDTMTLLFAADRLDHLQAEVLPALARGTWVVSDRYDLSSVAYQSATAPPGTDPEQVAKWVRECNEQAQRPDLVIVVDVDPGVAAERRAARTLSAELYEADQLQRCLAELYLNAGQLTPADRIVHVDGNGPIELVHGAIRNALRVLAVQFGMTLQG